MLKYRRVEISIIWKILNRLKNDEVRILKLQRYCGINTETCTRHLDFLVKMEWIKDIKEKRCRFIEITEEGRKYHEKFCKEYEYHDENDYFMSYI